MSSIVEMTAIDIETVPDPSKVHLLSEPTADARLKDPEKIAASKAKCKQEQVSKMALSPWTGRIASFAFAGGCDVAKIVPAEYEAEACAFIINKLSGHQFCTWNGMDFDLPFIWYRAMVLGVNNVNCPLSRVTRRYSKEPHIDLMQEFCGWGREKYMKLDFAAKVLLGDQKTPDFKVSEISDMIEAGKGDEVLAYNVQDAELTLRLYEVSKLYLF